MNIGADGHVTCYKPSSFYEPDSFPVLFEVLAHVSSREMNHDDLPRLTRRERQVLELCADGLTAQEIAVRLGVTFRTVNAHISAARSRLQALNKTHAIAIALRRGLIT